MPRFENMGSTGKGSRQAPKPRGRISLGAQKGNSEASLAGASMCRAGTMSCSKDGRLLLGVLSPKGGVEMGHRG